MQALNEYIVDKFDMTEEWSDNMLNYNIQRNETLENEQTHPINDFRLQWSNEVNSTQWKQIKQINTSFILCASGDDHDIWDIWDIK